MHRHLIVTGQNPYRVISYASATFDDLDFFMRQAGKSVIRVDPDEFLKQQTASTGNYINLVSRFPLRQEISQKLDAVNADRFSVFVDCYVPDLDNVGGGCLIYPKVSIYPSTKIDRDVIIHGGTGIAHRTRIGKGCYISGHVCISGSVHIGEYCWIAVKTTICDNISIAANTHTAIGSTVISNISETNTFFKKHLR